MKNYLLLFTLLFFGIQMSAQQPEDYFVTTWNVPDWGVITIRTNPDEIYNYTVDWGDGSPVEYNVTGDATHAVREDGGIYTVKITGTFPQFFYKESDNYPRSFLHSIEQWGNIPWRSMKEAFRGCENLVMNTIDNPNLSNVTDLSYMFYQVDGIYGYLNNWDVSNVTNMSNMFYQVNHFNEDIGNWNVSNVTDMSYMFTNTPFNHYIGDWDVSNVTTMRGMFETAKAFNQNIGGWNINNVTDFYNFLNRVTSFSLANYDALLNGWSTLTLPNSLTFNEPTLFYCSAEAARSTIVDKGWTIWDGGTDCLRNCTDQTTYNGSTWDNGTPTTAKKAVFASNYNTTYGSIDACSIQINEGVTVIVSENTTIRADNDIAIYGNLIFESTENGNGELGILGEKAAIVGNATVQRHMKAQRSYRMVSSSVTTSNSILENWQEGVHNTNTGNNQNPKPGFGTHITGSTSGANGFDATGTGNPSMFTVNITDQEFEVIGNTDVNRLIVGNAYLMLVRGDRGINLNSNNPEPTETRLRATGKLVWGNKSQKFNSPAPGAFIMFGNPYQSAVDMEQILGASKNVNKDFYYVYDPSLGEYGAYVTVDLVSGGNIPDIPGSSEANKYLQPGQGAQVAALSAGVVMLDFKETYKAPGEFTSTNATGNTSVTDGVIMGQLYTLENYNYDGPLHDAFAIRFAEGNSNSLTLEDAVKPMNFYENLGIDHNGTYLSLERRALPEVGEVFPLYTNGYNFTQYVMRIELNGLEDMEIYLDDHFTGETTQLVQGAITHPFTIAQTIPESKATNRFSIRVAERLNVNENEWLSGITLYPNPMGNNMTLSNPKNLQLDTASIYDLTGRLIKTMDLKEVTSEITLDVSTLSSSTYMVVITGEAGQISKLMVKE